MRRLLSKVIGPALLMAFWLWMSSVFAESREPIYFWLMAGFPYGIRKMWFFLCPSGDTQWVFCILMLNVILGCIIGVFVLAYRALQIVFNLICILLQWD